MDCYSDDHLYKVIYEAHDEYEVAVEFSLNLLIFKIYQIMKRSCFRFSCALNWSFRSFSNKRNYCQVRKSVYLLDGTTMVPKCQYFEDLLTINDTL